MTTVNFDSSARTWTTAELQEEFKVLGFMGGYVVVKRKSDGVRGSLMFDHSPRIYYSFMPHSKDI